MNSPVVNARQEAYQMRTMTTGSPMATNQSAAASLKESLKGNRRSLPASLEAAGTSSGGQGSGQGSGGPGSILGQKRTHPGNDGDGEH